MPYIPQFNKLSLQEMSYAPTLMRQQHDDAVAKQMELAEALKFDYLKQDAEGIEPVLQDYNKNIEDISKQISQQGFSHDLKNKVMGLRSKYVGDDKIRTYKKNYADAMSQWDEQRKRMIQEGRPGYDINAQKEAFFSGYSGAYTKDGLKNEFTSGKTSGYYDIGEDASKLMTNLGITEEPIIGSAGSIQRKTKDGDSWFEITNSRDGKITRNKDQIAAIKQYLKNEYKDEYTDRGLFKKINKLDDNYIDSVIDRIGEAKTIYKKEAEEDNVSGSGFSQQERSSGEMFPTYPKSQSDPKAYSQADDDLESISGNRLKKILEERAKISQTQATDPSSKSYLAALMTKSLQDEAAELEKQKQIRTKYANKYKEYFPEGVNVDDATRKAIETEKRNAASINQVTALTVDKNSYGGIGVTEMVLDKTFSPDVDLLESEEKSWGGLGGTKKLTKQEFIEKWGDSDYKNSKPLIDNSGDIFLRDPDDKIFKVNPRALDTNVQKLQTDVLKPILSQLTNVTLFDNNENKPVELPDFVDPQSGLKVLFMVEPKVDDEGKAIDPYDVSLRVVNMYGIDPASGTVKRKVEMTPAQAKNELAKGIFTGFTDIKL